MTAASPRAKVLVIDDEQGVLRFLHRILSKAHDVDTAATGERALELISSRSYEVILCDLMMPQMSGVEVYQNVADADPEQASRIVFMTGGAVTVRTQEFLETTTNRFVLKPFNAEAIRAVAAEVISRR